MKSTHIPVLLNRVIEILNPLSGETIVDGTTDGGGHMEAIIEKMGFKGTYVAVDLDEGILRETEKRITAKLKSAGAKSMKIVWANANYKDIPQILEKNGMKKADKLLLDLGWSTEQLASGRGFSYRDENRNEPLDMRFSADMGATAAEVLNGLKEEELADIFWKYGEERFSRNVAAQVVSARKEKKLATVSDLVLCITRAVPKFFKKGERDVITRVFQSLRIYVNLELENLESILKDIPRFVSKKGIVAIISFHSLEDRMVKNSFREMEKAGQAEILTKKPIGPDEEEISYNPKSRSAKLRAILIK